MTALDGLLFIDGKHRPGEEGRWHDIIDPATRERIGRTALATATDVDAAVTAARRAAAGWASTHADERANIILRAAALIGQRIDDIAEVLTFEQGKPVVDSRKEIQFGIQVLRYYAEEGRRVSGSLRPSSRSDIKSLVSYHPLGIVGAIVPWNYPVDLYCWKVGPALAAGCPVIVKPPHETPLAIDEIVKCFAEAELPPGVLANLPGTGLDAGVSLSEHPGIACISATASVSAGQDIMRRASINLKRLSLELGGHAPFIVLPDADIEEAAQAAMRRSFSNMGQICIAVNRILTHADVHAPFVEALKAMTAGIELGHGIEPGVSYGPVLNESVIDRVRAHISDAIQKGASIVSGGKRSSEGPLARGFFFEPTLIDDVPLNSLPMTEETYGPVAAIHQCTSIDQIEGIANSLPYGLAAYVYSNDLEAAWALADQLEFGAVGINVNDTTELQAPFGGWKMSGVGRELGPEGLETFLESKHIKMRVRERNV